VAHDSALCVATTDADAEFGGYVIKVMGFSALKLDGGFAEQRQTQTIYPPGIHGVMKLAMHNSPCLL